MRKKGMPDPARRGSQESTVPGVSALIRDRILSGALPPGAPVGSVTRLARHAGVVRSLVVEAVSQLTAEGFLEAGKQGSLVVAGGTAFRTEEAADPVPPVPGRFVPFRFDLIDFRPGVPDLSRFPARIWQRVASDVWRGISPVDLAYSNPEGRAELRREIARHLVSRRGVRCEPEQILITHGSTQAVGMAANLLLRGARPACIMEDPGSSETRYVLTGLGARILPVPADEHGIVTDALPLRAKTAFIHVTPAHQFPLGGTLPAQRRVKLLSYAKRHSAFIIEEDHDGDFRYDSPPVSALQGLSPRRVIYVGTYSMTLFPSLRIGYVVVPPALVAEMHDAKLRADVHTSTADQLILAGFIREGHYLRHLATMKKVYGESQALLRAALNRHFGGQVQILGAAAGVHLAVRFPGVSFTPTLLNRIEIAGVGVYPVEEYAIRKGHWEDALLFGFGMMDPRRINTGIAILKRCLPSS